MSHLSTAIILTMFHCRDTYTVEFRTIWSYCMLDFEVVGSTTSTAKYTELCSNHYDDIDTSKLNMATVNKLRRFLFGSDIEESKNILCPDERFLRILFGSMGRVFETIVRSCHRHVVDVGVGQA